MSIEERVLKAEELTRTTYKLRALLSSPSSGSGKTTSSITVPGKRKLVIDLDNRSECIAGEEGVEIVKPWKSDPDSPDAWDEVVAIKNELWSIARAAAKAGKPYPYDLIVGDGISGALRICMNWCLIIPDNEGRIKTGLGGTPAQHHYFPQMWNITKLIRSTLGLPCHVVWTGHENKVTENEGNINCWLPKITGKLDTEVATWFNETYYCYKEEGKGEKTKFFWLTSHNALRPYLKSSLNKRELFWSDPIQIDFNSPPVGFEYLLEKRFGPEKVV